MANVQATVKSAAFKRKLKAALGGMQKDVVKGVKLANAFIKADAQKRTPVDNGVLRASAYANVFSNGDAVVGEIGYVAEYAIWVHEAPMVLAGQSRKGKNADGTNKRGRYWDPQGKGENKFLEKAVDQNQSSIIKIIHRAAKI